MREISKWVKRLTLKGYKSELAGAGDVLMLDLDFHYGRLGRENRFFRAPRGRLHPEFCRFLNVRVILEGERRHVV